MNNLRIAMLSIHSCPLGQLGTRDTGGMNVYVRELSRELGKLGFNIDIFTRAHDPRDPQMETPFENVRLIHIKAGRVEDMGKMAQLSHLQEFARNMAEFNAGDGARYDIIHSHYWLSGLAGRQFAEAWGIPQVVMLHTLGAIKNMFPVGDKEPEIRLNAERGVMRSAQRIVTATADEKQQLAGLYGAPLEKIDVVPCGVNTCLFRPLDRLAARKALGFEAEEKVVLSVGRIEPLKGLDRLVEAFALLPYKYKKLVVIGGDEHSGEEVARLRALAGELGVGDRVILPGTVKQERLPEYYSAADVTAVGSYYESFCLIILESLSCGTPVVSTAVGVAPGVIRSGENGLVVAGNEPVALSEAMSRVLSRGWDAGRIRSSSAGYAWPSVARQISSVYASVLSLSSVTV
jgi:D-inositol-3-phosphate glycosyltransferase